MKELNVISLGAGKQSSYMLINALEGKYGAKPDKVIWNDGNVSIYPDEEKIESLLSDLTALISEGYVSKEKHDKVLQQRDELREALKNLMDGVRGLPPLTAIVGVLEKQYKQAEAAIKNTDG